MPLYMHPDFGMVVTGRLGGVVGVIVVRGVVETGPQSKSSHVTT